MKKKKNICKYTIYHYEIYLSIGIGVVLDLDPGQSCVPRHFRSCVMTETGEFFSEHYQQIHAHLIRNTKLFNDSK